MKSLEKIWENPSFWAVDQVRHTPNPFPGKYPTRWKICFLEKKDQVVWQYIGKPDPNLIKRIQRVSAHHRGIFTAVEFDRGGSIRGIVRNTPTKNFQIQYSNGTLMYFYYPWQDTSNFFGPWTSPVYFKRMELPRGHDAVCRFYVYSPYSQMIESKVDYLREYRGWLRKTELLKSLI